MAFNAAIGGSILAELDACLVIMMALPFGSTQAGAPAEAIRVWAPALWPSHFDFSHAATATRMSMLLGAQLGRDTR